MRMVCRAVENRPQEDVDMEVIVRGRDEMLRSGCTCSG